VIKEKKLSRTLAASRELQETSNFYFIHSSGHDAACLQQGYQNQWEPGRFGRFPMLPVWPGT
jgi:hypothetical protein